MRRPSNLQFSAKARTLCILGLMMAQGIATPAFGQQLTKTPERKLNYSELVKRIDEGKVRKVELNDT
jgi:hypothetical protein